MVNELRIWLPAILAFVAVALGTVSIVLIWETARIATRRRLVLRRLRAGEDIGGDTTTTGLIRSRDRDHASQLERALSHVPRLRDTGFRLSQAGLDWGISTYVMLSVGWSMAFGIAVLMVAGSLLAALVGAVFGALLPEFYVRRLRNRRARSFEEQFPEAIDLMGRAIRAGHPLSAGIRMVADEAPDPVASEFRQVFEEQRFGLPFEDALIGLSDRNDLVDVRIFVTAVLIQREVGGNLAEILDKIAQTVRARFAILRQLRVYTAQGRLSGYVLAALPVVMAIAIFFLNRPYIMELTRGLGKLLVIMAVIMQIVGYLWIRKIVNIEI